MRNLELIREQSDVEKTFTKMVNTFGGILVVGGGLVALVFAARTDSAAAYDESDPLAALSAEEMPRTMETEALEAPKRIKREELSFPEELASATSLSPRFAPPQPPGAAIAAAAAPTDNSLALTTLVPAAPEATQGLTLSASAAPRFRPGLPAGSMQRARDELSGTDPLLNDLPADEGGSRARAGTEGAYTLQVISYESPEEAENFAETLRERGHRAFVTTATVETRGRVYRVRIGPFSSMNEASTYRHEFERTERMNTFVVRRDAAPNSHAAD